MMRWNVSPSKNGLVIDSPVTGSFQAFVPSARPVKLATVFGASLVEEADDEVAVVGLEVCVDAWFAAHVGDSNPAPSEGRDASPIDTVEQHPDALARPLECGIMTAHSASGSSTFAPLLAARPLHRRSRPRSARTPPVGWPPATSRRRRGRRSTTCTGRGRGAGAGLDRAAKVNVFLKHASDFARDERGLRADLRHRSAGAHDRRLGAAAPRRARRDRDGAGRARASRARSCIRRRGQRSPNPYSYGIRSGDTLFLAGLVSRRGADNSMVPGDMATQMRTILDNAEGAARGRRHGLRRRRQLARLHHRRGGLRRDERRLRDRVPERTRRRGPRSASS